MGSERTAKHANFRVRLSGSSHRSMRRPIIWFLAWTNILKLYKNTINPLPYNTFKWVCVNAWSNRNILLHSFNNPEEELICRMSTKFKKNITRFSILKRNKWFITYKWTIKVGTVPTHVAQSTASLRTYIGIFMGKKILQKLQHRSSIDVFIESLETTEPKTHLKRPGNLPRQSTNGLSITLLEGQPESRIY